MPTADDLRSLALHELAEPVLSVYARTDARDPANTNHVPGWLIALRNGLRAVEDPSRHPELPALLERIEREATALAPSERGRSFAWFVTPDGALDRRFPLLDRRFPLQIPLQDDLVVLDDRPFISPLVEVVDRGSAAQLVLVGSETVRLLRWEQGSISEPEDSTWEMSLGDWRDYQGPAAAGQHTATHAEHFDARVDESRRKFFDSVGASLASRFEALGDDRVVIAGEGRMTRAFANSLSASARERVIDVIDSNVNDGIPSDVGRVLELLLERHWRQEVIAAAAATAESALGGGSAALGPDETLASLVQARVERLFLDPHFDYAMGDLGPQARQAFDSRDARIAEVAVELAIAGGARVTAVDSTVTAVAEAGGMLAQLRY